jgi:hypothetical protein
MFIVSLYYLYLSAFEIFCIRGRITFLVRAVRLGLFFLRVIEDSDPGFKVVALPPCQRPEDLVSQLSTELKVDLRTARSVLYPLRLGGLAELPGAIEALVGLEAEDFGRGALPFKLALIHAPLHVLTVKRISAGWAHLSVGVHSFDWRHK